MSTPRTRPFLRHAGQREGRGRSHEPAEVGTSGLCLQAQIRKGHGAPPGTAGRKQLPFDTRSARGQAIRQQAVSKDVSVMPVKVRPKKEDQIGVPRQVLLPGRPNHRGASRAHLEAIVKKHGQ